MTLTLPRPSERYDPQEEARRNLALEQADRQNWKRTGDVDHPHSLTVRGELNTPGIHNNAGMGDANSAAVASGTYTPTLTNVANLDASTAYECQWLRVGNVVTVSGRVDVDPTAAGGTLTRLGISLPVASAFTTNRQCAGVAYSYSAIATAYIVSDATNDRAEWQIPAAFTSNGEFYFTFTYQVI